MEQSDNNIILQFSQGDTRAFSVIYNEYYPKVHGFVRQFIREREDAQDITAEIFVKLWRMRATISGIKNLQAFLYITSRNTCIDFLRFMKRQQEKRAALTRLLEQTPQDGNLPDDLRTELLQFIYQQINELPGNCRKVFAMSYLEGRTTAEIAETMKINPQSVYNYRQKALKLLRMAILNRRILISLLLLGCIFSRQFTR